MLLRPVDGSSLLLLLLLLLLLPWQCSLLPLQQARFGKGRST